MRDYLTQVAQAYYDYLVSANKGVQDIELLSTSQENNIFIFSLKQKIFSLDCIVFESPDFSISFDDEQIVDKRYHEELRRLEIQVSDMLALRFKEAINAKKLRIYSNLRFLVLKLKDFFTEQDIVFPTKKPSFAITPNPKLAPPQQKALEGLLNSTISYIWGPPGCGKTQFVLFEALLHYIKQDKKVCVLAPTNNALEQILRTLVAKMDTLGIDRGKILRLGTPTLNFMQTFEDICDPYIMKQKKQDLFSGSLDPRARYQEARIFAMTMDGFIRRYGSLQTKFAHIFLDEGAFTPLIKALAICVDNTPLTILGDHKQLTPICEMEERRMHGEFEKMKLWNFSALFLEDFFFDKNLLQKSTTATPSFSQTQVFKLNQTYRYGSNLAQILNQSIYHMPEGLQGAGEPTQIYFIDAPRIPTDGDMTSEQEAREIYRLTRELREGYAIITPFKKQREMIMRQGIAPYLVMTIHASQGQEFDTIIFSPVKLHYHLTDSNKNEALYALNVAISRLKKTLILVCDYRYWIRQEGQFLTQLLKQAAPYPRKIL